MADSPPSEHEHVSQLGRERPQLTEGHKNISSPPMISSDPSTMLALDDSTATLDPDSSSSPITRPTHGGTPVPPTKIPIPGPQQTNPADFDTSLISPSATDRVFPIRSFVSVDPTPTPSLVTERRDSYFTAPGRASTRRSSTGPASTAAIPEQPQYSRRPGATTEQRPDSERPSERSRMNSTSLNPSVQDAKSQNNPWRVFTDATSMRSESVTSAGDVFQSENFASAPSNVLDEAANPPALVTARFKHVVTAEGHAIITGRGGDVLQRCEDEPIHIPGAVQSFGLLIALQEIAEGKLLVRIVSENSQRILGYTPQQLFNLESFTDIMSDDQADNLLDHIDFIKDDGTDVEANGPEVFTMSLRNANRRTQKLWCAIHINAANPDVIICEFELEDDPLFPLVPAQSATPEPPESTLQSRPTDEEFRESTEAMNRPLRVLRSARKRRGEAAAMEVFNIMSQVQEQLAEAPNLDAFLKVLVGVIKELTGFHRVMIYQFDAAWNGKVVTELVDPRATTDLYKGLHFPASDIPRQARDLYRLNRVRLLYDRDLETARLVCRTTDDLEKPLDLTHSYLRAMSPIHIKYLANMAVRSSMSISINAFNELWGLISCHAYGPKGTRVSFPIRKMCRLVGDSASRNIERLSYASRLQARKLINTASTEQNPSGYIIASSEDLLKLFDADYGLLSIHDETKILGKLEATQEALALLEYLRLRKFTSVITSQDIRIDFPDLRYPPGFQVVAGLLSVPLSVRGDDFIVFFRKGQLREVKWAGNPYEKFIKAGTEGYLEPRKSFKSWSETVIGKCREWTEDEIETAAVLCLVYGKFIEVWRQKEAALQNSQLTKLLLANSAHEVRTPLNAIINYLEIALEGSLDNETRENLARSHSASKSLIYVINDLLDLTKSTAKPELDQGEVFDLKHTFLEATDMFQGDAKRKQISLEVFQKPDIPDKVLGEQRRVRQAISNLTANAIQATTQGRVTVEMAVIARYERSVDIEVAVEDTGVGMNSRKLDDLFAELEQAQSDPDILLDDTTTDMPSLTDAKSDRKILGLGLAIVARIVRNMDGQLRLKSEEGKGSRFVLQFPFKLPTSDSTQKTIQAPPDPASGPLESPLTPSRRSISGEPGEVLLVDKTGTRRDAHISPTLSRKNSAGSFESKRSMTSLASGKSLGSNASGKSDVDRLIEAMQEPITAERPSLGGRHPSRSGRLSLAEGERNLPTSPVGRSFAPEAIDTVDTTVQVTSSQTRSSLSQRSVADSRTPIRVVRVPDELDSPTLEFQPRRAEVSGIIGQVVDGTLNASSKAANMHVLVAEDDPVNSKIIEKRLQRAGHRTWLTVNGEDCVNTYKEHPQTFDVILMDMQMPFVDGLGATRKIRAIEATRTVPFLSERAALNGRVPIIAVSASLIERELNTYVDAGFDGWILKPISFSRLKELMTGIVDNDIRRGSLYERGYWEHGGWFHAGKSDVSSSPPAAHREGVEDAASPIKPSDPTPQATVSVGATKTSAVPESHSSSMQPEQISSTNPQQP